MGMDLALLFREHPGDGFTMLELPVSLSPGLGNFSSPETSGLFSFSYVGAEVTSLPFRYWGDVMWEYWGNIRI